MLQIDGSYGEGGGQIIRTSLSLSILTSQPVEIVNIRARRSKPGLQPQHLTAVRAAAAICGARLEGDATGSSRIVFAPQAPPQPGTYHFDIGTAGSGPLVAQTILAPLARSAAASRVTIVGGTHVPHSPPAEYLETVYLPTIGRAGFVAHLETPLYGFFPRGGGRLEIQIPAQSELSPLDLTERGKLTRLKAFVVTSQLPDHVAQRGQSTVEKLMRAVGRSVEVERRDRPSHGPGAAVILCVECDPGRAAFTAIGARGKPMEQVAEEACAPFMEWWRSGAACDEHLADQLVLPLALAGAESRWTTPRVTDHLRTSLWVAQRFLSIDFSIQEEPGRPARITIRSPVA
ncbi:MAG TPA: RNA 3'-terminal phosphate cyclase [Armatimonadota bacterium]|nr:RNA 3'-terminal phosphate cyclase [Armatimonadota bacterium]